MTNKKIIRRLAKIIRRNTNLGFITSLEFAKMYLNNTLEDYCSRNDNVPFSAHPNIELCNAVYFYLYCDDELQLEGKTGSNFCINNNDVIQQMKREYINHREGNNDKIMEEKIESENQEIGFKGELQQLAKKYNMNIESISSIGILCEMIENGANYPKHVVVDRNNKITIYDVGKKK